MVAFRTLSKEETQQYNLDTATYRQVLELLEDLRFTPDKLFKRFGAFTLEHTFTWDETSNAISLARRIETTVPGATVLETFEHRIPHRWRKVTIRFTVRSMVGRWVEKSVNERSSLDHEEREDDPQDHRGV